MKKPTFISSYLHPKYKVEQMLLEDDQITVVAQATKQVTICPDCQAPTRRVHSYYSRIPHDLPCGIYSVRLHLKVRRMRCMNPACVRKTFAEQIPAFLPPHAQRTLRLTCLLKKLVFEINGEAGARICHHLNIRSSPDTLIRIVRRTKPPVHPTPTVIGVDDWAKRKGMEYGTLIVDLEQRCPIDVLPDRTAESLDAWLRKHPTIQIVCRDRFPAYIESITSGAPTAQQIADRWHLLKNLSNALRRMFSGLSQELQSIADQLALQQDAFDGVMEEVQKDQTSSTQPSEREVLLQEVKKLAAEGYSNRQIAKMLPIHRSTVAKYLQLDQPPTRGKKEHTAAPFQEFLLQRWAEGCHSPKQLWLEIKSRGFTGGLGSLYRFLVHLGMKAGEHTLKLKPRRLSARQASWLLIAPDDKLDEYQRSYRDELCDTFPAISEARTLANQFILMITEQKAEQFSTWLEDAKECSVTALRGFARKLDEDYDAVHAALQFDWSNGQLEGQVNRLKTIKRQMYGRANFDLLRLRVLCL
jgi:transposase